jgi:hypothetical protein
VCVSVDATIDEFDRLLLDDVSLGPELFGRLRETGQTALLMLED